MLESLIFYTGAGFLLYKITQVASFFFVYFIRPGQDLTKLGEWSVVTGCTAGIGKGIASELAKKGQNVVLISRNQQKLEDVQKEIEALGVKTKIVVADLSKFDEAAKQRVTDACSPLNIGVLVNNAGVSYPYPQWFEDIDVERAENICKINCEALVTMTRLILPQMIAQNKGTVVNMSSVQGVVPSQLMVVYGASKAFVNNFTDNMTMECKGKGVTFSSHMPMYVISNMSKIRRQSMTVPTPEAYARAAVKHFGYSGTISPYWSHSFYAAALQQLPRMILEPIIMSAHKTIRKKALKKYNKTK